MSAFIVEVGMNLKVSHRKNPKNGIWLANTQRMNGYFFIMPITLVFVFIYFIVVDQDTFFHTSTFLWLIVFT